MQQGAVERTGRSQFVVIDDEAPRQLFVPDGRPGAHIEEWEEVVERACAFDELLRGDVGLVRFGRVRGRWRRCVVTGQKVVLDHLESGAITVSQVEAQAEISARAFPTHDLTRGDIIAQMQVESVFVGRLGESKRIERLVEEKEVAGRLRLACLSKRPVKSEVVEGN